MDMRLVEPGSVIDEFHFSMWAGFVEFMLGKPDIRAEFEAETGARFIPPARNGLEAAIDRAAGVDRSNLDYIGKFAAWATPLYFGGPEDISPAIAKKLVA